MTSSASRVSNSRENTVQQQLNSFGASEFHERNNLYESGLEMLVPTGARLKLGYNLQDLHNNLQRTSFSSRGATNGEFQSFFGVSLTQPLLKNGGFAATLAEVRLAALSSKIAFQEYRRQMMMIVSAAEAAYWNLYLAQEQVRFFRESVATAETILLDNRARLQAGKNSELEVLEAEAGLALRRTKLGEAEAKLYEVANQVNSFCSETASGTNSLVHATEAPRLAAGPVSFDELQCDVFDLNPDYLAQHEKWEQEGIRLAYARRQRLPELDLKGSYGFNGLGSTPGASWHDIAGNNWPSWMIGLELRVPIWGDIKGRMERDAARLRIQQAELSLREAETQIINALDTALQKMRSAANSYEGRKVTLGYNQRLLEAALARLEAGKIESRKVLEIEADLFEAKNMVVEALVNHERAALELQLTQGSTLKRRNLEVTQRQLERTTARLVKGGRMTQQQYDEVLKGVRELRQTSQPPPPSEESLELRKARRLLERELERIDREEREDRSKAAVPTGDERNVKAAEPAKESSH
jgi:outer membrane protein TolC